MITRVEISGFKTFTDFAVDLAPLSVIAGANASGKSNFLDALQLVQGLTAGKSLDEILQGRGTTKDFLTKYGPDLRSKSIVIAVELLLPKTIKDNHGVFTLEGNRFRYEIHLSEHHHQHFTPFQVDYEKLSILDQEEDLWAKKYLTLEQLSESVKYPERGNKQLFFRGVGTMDGETQLGIVSGQLVYSTLSNASGNSNPHINAVRQSLLRLEYVSLSDGNNFSNYENKKNNKSLILRELKELAEIHPQDLHLLSMRVSQIAKSVNSIKVKVDEFDRVSLIATDKNGARYLSDSLSEGTLRTIALATLLFSKTPQRTILLEEPENGIDPRVLSKLVDLLKDLATNLMEDDVPLVQVICTTHSPALLEMIVETNRSHHATAYLASIGKKIIKHGSEKMMVGATRIYPVVQDIDAPVAESRMERATLHQAKEYMKYGRPESLVDV